MVALRFIAGLLVGWFITRAIIYPDSENFWLYIAIVLASISVWLLTIFYEQRQK